MSFCSFSLGNSILFYGFNYHLQNIPQNQSETLTSLLNFSLKCPNVSLTYAWVVCCHFKLSMLKTNLSSCPPPNQLDASHISIGCTLSQVQTSVLVLIFLSSSFKAIFSFFDVSSLTIRIPLFIPVLCGNGTYHYLSLFFFHPSSCKPLVNIAFCLQVLMQTFLFIPYLPVLFSLYFFFLITLFPFSSLQHLFNINEIGQGGRWDDNVCVCSFYTYM